MTVEPTPVGDVLQPLACTDAYDFEALVAENMRALYSVCLRLLRDPCAAEDACQETLIAAWRHREGGALCRTWLLHVAVNKCRDELRRRGRRPFIACDVEEAETEAIPASEPTPEALVLGGDACREIERALMCLPWPQRISLVLGDVEGWSYQEIAAATSASLGTVKSRIHRGRVRLREILAGRQPTTP